MATSPITYDLQVCYAPGDDFIAKNVAARLRCCNFRPWLPRDADPADKVQFGLADEVSPVGMSVLGPAGLTFSAYDQRWSYEILEKGVAIVLLAPGFPHGPSALPYFLAEMEVVDMRQGLQDVESWKHVATAIRRMSQEPATGVHPAHLRGSKVLKHHTIKSYDRIAEKFTSQWFHHPPLVPLQKFLQLLPCQAVVLDAGCGPGHHTELIARIGHRVIGIDLSDQMLKIARKSVCGVQFRKMDIQALSFKPGTFDAIWCAAVALHVPREEFVWLLHDFRRALKPGGLLGINLQIGRQSEVVDYGNDRRFFEYYRDNLEVESLLRIAGFSVDATDYGETTRNTHDLDLRLKWLTLFARSTHGNTR